MRSPKRWQRALVPAVALALAACRAGRHEPIETYYLVVANTTIAYWQDAYAGLRAAARELGVRCEMVGPEKYDPKAQKQDFQKVLSRKPAPAGILVSAADPELMRDAIDAAIAAGIPVVTMDSDSPTSKRLLFIGTNNYEAGQMGGEAVAKALNGKGNIAVYTIAGQANLEERLEGYRRFLAGYPQIRLAETIDIKGDAAAAFDATQKLVERGKNVPEAFVCLEALSCPEVAEVLDRAKVRDKVVVAMDTNQSTIEWIDKGMIHATIAQKPFTMAYYGLRVLDDLHHHRLARLDGNWSQDDRSPVPMFIDTGATLVDKSNVKTFLEARRATP